MKEQRVWELERYDKVCSQIKTDVVQIIHVMITLEYCTMKLGKNLFPESLRRDIVLKNFATGNRPIIIIE